MKILITQNKFFTICLFFAWIFFTFSAILVHAEEEQPSNTENTTQDPAPGSYASVAEGSSPPPYVNLDEVNFFINKLNIYDGSTSGAFIYSFPLEIPKGRNEMQPKLNLMYNHQDNDNQNLFGFGWSVDIPYIQRFDKEGIDNLYTTNNFNSSLSGELVGTDLNDDMDGIYAARIDDGDYYQYQYSSSTDKWMATDKGGMVYTFGSTAASRQDDPSDNSRVYKWMLEETRDTNDNYVRYEYYKDNGQIYPAKIFYTGHDSTDGIYEVEFIRQARTDNASSLKTGFAVVNNYRISEIQIKINDVWVKKYNLNYTYEDEAALSYLDTIVESGKDSNGNTVSLPANDFNYQTTEDNWTNNTNWVLPMPMIDTDYGDIGVRLVDVNGDGLIDIVKSFNGPHNEDNGVYINDGTGWILDTNWTIPAIIRDTSWDNRNSEARFVDVNADGLPDLVKWHSYLLASNPGEDYVWINKGSGWDLDTNWQLPEPISDMVDGDVGTRFADINNDGLVDVLRSCGYCYTPNVNKVYINNGSGWILDTNWVLPELFSNGPAGGTGTRLEDVNGDNLVDIVRGWDDATTDVNKVYINNGSGWTLDTNWVLPELLNYFNYNGRDLGVRFIDVNNDGLVDMAKGNLDDNNQPHNYIYINNGSGWDLDTNWELSEAFIDYLGKDLGTRLLDIDSDGLVDIVRSWKDWNQQQTAFGSYLKNGETKFLDEINTAKGSQINISYNPSTHEEDSMGNLVNPKLPYIIHTVKQIVTDDGLGNVSAIEYNYADGEQYDDILLDRRFAGFGKITKEEAYTKTTTYYHQGNDTNSSQGEYQDGYYKIGRPYRVETRDSSTDQLLKSEINKWEDYDRGDNNNFVYNSQKINIDFVGITKSTASQFQYSTSTGNLLTESNLGEVNINTDTGVITNTLPGDEKDTDYDYAINTTKHILSAPKTKTISDSLNSKQQDIYYNNQAYGQVDKVNPTKEDYIADDVEINRSFNSYGLVYEQSDPKYATTTIGYDSYNMYPYTTTDPLSNVTYTEYNLLNGQVATTTNPNGKITKNSYDAFGRLVEVKISDKDIPSTLVLKQSISYQDTSLPRYKESKNYFDTNSYTTSREYYDGLNRVIQTKSQTGTSGEYSTIDISYDSQGRVERQSLPYVTTSISYSTPNLSQPAKTYTYDALDRVLTEVTPVGTTSYAYNGFTTTITDANGNIKDLTKDAYGNLVEVKEHNGVSTYTTSYDYSLTNKLEKITDSQGNIRNFHYDALDNLDSQDMVHIPSATSTPEITYTHDKNGNVLTETSFKGDNISYVYDDLNRVLYEKLSNNNKITYTYDLNGDIGQLSDVVYADGNRRQYDYDILGNLRTSTTTIEGEDFVMHFNYNLNGDIKSITYPNNFVVTYGFNSAGQVTSVSLDKGSGPVVLVDNITYNQNGQMTHLERSNNVDTTYYYDPNENFRLTDLDTTSAITTLQDIHYTYDNVGNISQIADNSDVALAKTVLYNYDDLNRLTSSTVNYASSTIADYQVDYEYDSIGNMTFNSDVINFDNFNYDNDNPHQLSSYLLTNLSYDGAGNLLDNGNISFYWDHRNRVNKTYNTSTEDYTYYEYDHNNQRLLKYTEAYVYVNPIPDPTDPVDPITKAEGLVYLATEQGPYWEWRRIKEDKYVDNYFEQNKSNQNKTHIFLNGTKIATVNHNDNPYFILSDHLNSSSILVDNTGAIKEMTDYLPYGKINYEDITTNLANDYTFTGQEYDEENSLQYYGARYMDNEVGRFISIDPALLVLHDKDKFKKDYKFTLMEHLAEPQKLNSYSYALNNPVVVVDLDGNYSYTTTPITLGIASLQLTNGFMKFVSGVNTVVLGIATSLNPVTQIIAPPLLDAGVGEIKDSPKELVAGVKNLNNAIIKDAPPVRGANAAEDFSNSESKSYDAAQSSVPLANTFSSLPGDVEQISKASTIMSNARSAGVGGASTKFVAQKSGATTFGIANSISEYFTGHNIIEHIQNKLFSAYDD